MKNPIRQLTVATGLLLAAACAAAPARTRHDTCVPVITRHGDGHGALELIPPLSPSPSRGASRCLPRRRVCAQTSPWHEVQVTP